MKTIVLATDFEDGAAPVADYALAFAHRLHARLVIVHAYKQRPDDATAESVPVPLRLEHLRARLMGISKGSVEIAMVARYGDPRTCIEAVVAEQQADLLIMALADERPYTARFVGSLPTEMIPQTAVSMLILPPGVPDNPIKTVVLALDLSEPIDAVVLGKAKMLVQALDASLAIVSMNDDPDPQEQAAAERIRELFGGLPHTFSFQPGNDLGIMLDDYIDSHPADLIVMLPKHHSRLAVWLTESVTQQVARQATVPVLALV
jgi:nucleotide-binding universal stress UspA family protein